MFFSRYSFRNSAWDSARIFFKDSFRKSSINCFQNCCMDTSGQSTIILGYGKFSTESLKNLKYFRESLLKSWMDCFKSSSVNISKKIYKISFRNSSRVFFRTCSKYWSGNIPWTSSEIFLWILSHIPPEIFLENLPRTSKELYPAITWENQKFRQFWEISPRFPGLALEHFVISFFFQKNVWVFCENSEIASGIPL